MRRLICISNSIADTFKWRTSMGLSNHHIRHWSPYENPNKMRGLSEVNDAIVWVDRPALSSDHYRVLDLYRALSILEFDGRQRTVILDWLMSADDDPSAVPLDERARRAYDCGEYVVALLTRIMVVAAMCWAIDRRARREELTECHDFMMQRSVDARKHAATERQSAYDDAAQALRQRRWFMYPL